MSWTRCGPDGRPHKAQAAGSSTASALRARPRERRVAADSTMAPRRCSSCSPARSFGTDRSTTPVGSPSRSNTGAAISPDDGYSFDGLQRNTGVQIDPSGNVWLANNWDDVPQIGDPFGDGLVVFLGLAAPVAAPLIGPPQQP